MDDELQQLEAELKRLAPAAPSPRLVERIGCQFAVQAAPSLAREGRAGPAASLPSRSWWVWSLVPAAAAITLLCSVTIRPTTAVAARDVLKPVAAQNVLYSATDEGLVTLADGTTARRERLQFVDTITWRNPRTRASLTWTVPREEVRVVPVGLQ